MNAAKFQSPGRYPEIVSGPAASQGDGDEINLSDYLGVLFDNKWLIAGVAIIALLAGTAYAMLARPVYEANLLIQVEDSKGAGSSILGEASSLFDVKTPSAGEIEIMRSRMVIGQAVESTRFYIDARPRYVPVIGSWLARHAQELSEPGLWGLTSAGMGGYVSGTEEILVPHLELSPGLQGAHFTVTAGENGEYALDHEGLVIPLHGKVGLPLNYSGADGNVNLLVAKLEGRPGAQFLLRRSSRIAAISYLQGRLQLAEKGRQSGVIEATLQDEDPRRLTVVLNEIGHQYVRQNVERKAAEAQKTLSFLNEQLPQYKRQQEEAEEVYNRYRNQKGTVAFDEEAKLALGQAVELQTKLLEAKQRHRELAARFTSSHPSIQTLNAQIAAWNREIDNLNARVKRMPEIQQDALRMERDVRVNAEMYQSLLNNALQLSLVKEGKVGNVRLLDEAVVPETPVKPQKSQILTVSAALGLLAGILLAFVRNSFLRGIRSPQEIEERTGLNVYATIPLSSAQGALAQRIAARRSGVHLLAVSNPADSAIESLRSLRTALQFAMLEAPNNRVLISGATPGVGKTFVSANFAAIMAAGGKRVLLIDADMRKGYINQHLGLKREHGLSELIAGSLTATDVIHPQVVPGLDVITTGELPPNPAELMMSDSFAQILDALSVRYDLIIVDTPPVLVAADTAAVSLHAGTVLLVARADETYLGELQESAKRLAHAGKAVTGVLFNGMDVTRRSYGAFGYRYGGYRYTDYSYRAGAGES